MASETIWGNFSGTSTSNVRPALEWTSTSNIQGNYSDVKVSLVFYKYNSRWKSWSTNHPVTMTIHGHSSSTGRPFDIRNTTRDVIWTRTRRVDHDSDGNKTISISASGNTEVSLGTYNFSGNAELDMIPRESKISSVNNFTLGNDINLSYDIKYSGFRHDLVFKMRSNNKEILRFDNIRSLPSSVSFNSDQNDVVFNSLPNSESGVIRVYLNTRDSLGNFIGQDYKDIRATIPEYYRPEISNLKVWINGSGRDNTIGKFVQSISRASASFDVTAPRGGSIRSNSITIRKDSDESDSFILNGKSGTTGVLNRNGTYEVIATSVDSRGRENTARTTFLVHEYRPPSFSYFGASRDILIPTNVHVRRAGRHTSLDGDNLLTIEIDKRKNGESYWTNVDTSQTAGSNDEFDLTIVSSGNEVTSSYEFRAVIRDQFGNMLEAQRIVSTARVVLDIHKNEGVGIGKLRERGVLDVDGETYIRGILTAQSSETGGFAELATDSGFGNSGLRLGDDFRPSTPFIDFYGLAEKRTAEGFTDDFSRSARIIASGGRRDREYAGLLELLAGVIKTDGDLNVTGRIMRNNVDVIDSATGDNGTWILFHNGVLIQYHSIYVPNDTFVSSGSIARSSGLLEWYYPMTFAQNTVPIVIPSVRRSGGNGAYWPGHIGTTHGSNTNQWRAYSQNTGSNVSWHMQWLAIGVRS